MDRNFWLQRWRDGQIGFHRPEVNAGLQRYWAHLGIAAGARVLVPLCGKSRDLSWLAKRHPVMGVELSERAVAGFFAETGQRAQQQKDGEFSVYSADGVSLYCGDFFRLQPAMLHGIAAVYDRAALIALPQGMRARYVDLMTHLLPAGVSMLLMSMDYPQTKMDGPPFAVSAAEVEALFSPRWRIELLHRADILDQEPKFRARGLPCLVEEIYHLVKC